MAKHGKAEVINDHAASDDMIIRKDDGHDHNGCCNDDQMIILIKDPEALLGKHKEWQTRAIAEINSLQVHDDALWRCRIMSMTM